MLILAGLYFLIPIYGGLNFALRNNANHLSFSTFTSIPSQQGFSSSLTLSLKLAGVTLVIALALMIPTAVLVHLRYPKLRRVFDGITFLPIVIPPVVLIVGVLQVDPTWIKGSSYLLAIEYAVLAMPFTYRALDAGLSALDVRTLFEASRSLGGSWSGTLRRVVVPNMLAGVLSAAVLTVATVLGEYTMASLDQYQTLPVWIAAFAQDNGHVSTAVSILSMLITWAILLILVIGVERAAGRKGRQRQAGAVAAGGLG